MQLIEQYVMLIAHDGGTTISGITRSCRIYQHHGIQMQKHELKAKCKLIISNYFFFVVFIPDERGLDYHLQFPGALGHSAGIFSPSNLRHPGR